jgi:hypothetical protein
MSALRHSSLGQFRDGELAPPLGWRFNCSRKFVLLLERIRKGLILQPTSTSSSVNDCIFNYLLIGIQFPSPNFFAVYVIF